MPMKLSARAASLQPSLTLAIAARAKQLQAEGQNICSLSAGEPNFDTPAFIRQAAAEALEQGLTRYGPAAGDPALRQAIAEKLSRCNGMAVSSDQVLVTNGGKQALYNLFQVLLDPGDEVLLPAPYWLTYPELARLAGAEVRLLSSNASDGFRLDLEALEALITPKSRLLVLNTPSNPTGLVLQRRSWKPLPPCCAAIPRWRWSAMRSTSTCSPMGKRTTAWPRWHLIWLIACLW